MQTKTLTPKEVKIRHLGVAELGQEAQGCSCWRGLSDRRSKILMESCTEKEVLGATEETLGRSASVFQGT